MSWSDNLLGIFGDAAGADATGPAGDGWRSPASQPRPPKPLSYEPDNAGLAANAAEQNLTRLKANNDVLLWPGNNTGDLLSEVTAAALATAHELNVLRQKADSLRHGLQTEPPKSASARAIAAQLATVLADIETIFVNLQATPLSEELRAVRRDGEDPGERSAVQTNNPAARDGDGNARGQRFRRNTRRGA